MERIKSTGQAVAEGEWQKFKNSADSHKVELADKALERSRELAWELYSKLRNEMAEENEKMLIAVQEAAKEAAREIFAACDTTELPASVAAKIDEAENAGIASAAKEFTKCSTGVDVSRESWKKDMQTKMEMEGARVAKEEFVRLVTEVEEAKRKMEREHR